MNNEKIIDWSAWGYNLLVKVGDHVVQALVLLLMRLHWGWAFFETGKGKLLNHSDVADFFTSLGIPFPSLNAWFVGGVECVGGALLMVGLCSRPIALMLSVNMLVAYLSVTSDRAKLLGIFSDPDAFVAADPFFYLFLALMVFAFGPGLLSLDALLGRTVFKRWRKA